MNEEVKPGYKTTEFWITLATMLIGILAHVGYLSPEQVGDVTSKANSIITNLFELIAVAGPVVYIYGRSILKKDQAAATNSRD